VSCTGCNYCMPCPHNVNIPGCFAAYNSSFVTGFVSGLQQYLTSIGANHSEKSYRSSNCVKCGKCEKQCPQHIGVIKSLEAVTKRMEPFWFNPALKLISMFTK
ncbi:MAG: 4Fe-4S dicluster domain-containing protein, partial [Clostridiales bacterium]|nr:4Fe-4S dicluster domain-containing protein [Clostridiales bacterium]